MNAYSIAVEPLIGTTHARSLINSTRNCCFSLILAFWFWWFEHALAGRFFMLHDKAVNVVKIGLVESRLREHVSNAPAWPTFPEK